MRAVATVLAEQSNLHSADTSVQYSYSTEHSCMCAMYPLQDA